MWQPQLYQSKHGFVYEFGEELLSMLEPKEDETILDLGCGTGELTHRISQSCKEVVGIDKSPGMIQTAQINHPGIIFKVEDASGFQLDSTFDAIFSNAALHWVTDFEGAIQCMYHHLKPEGRIVLEFGGKGNVATIVSQLRVSLRQRGYLKQSELQQWYFPSIGEYCAVLEDHSFKVNAAFHFDRPTPLTEPETGIIDWLNMFAQNFFEGVPSEEIHRITLEVQDQIRSESFKNGKWFADYKRIRIHATKEL